MASGLIFTLILQAAGSLRRFADLGAKLGV
jgi:hypothetical protein